VPIVPTTPGKPNRRNLCDVSLGKAFSQNGNAKKGDGVAQVVAYLPSKGETLRTTPTTTKTKQTITKKQKAEQQYMLVRVREKGIYSLLVEMFILTTTEEIIMKFSQHKSET
jgi:hypothetical protein